MGLAILFCENCGGLLFCPITQKIVKVLFKTNFINFPAESYSQIDVLPLYISRGCSILFFNNRFYVLIF